MTVGRTCSHQGLRERNILSQNDVSIRASERGSKSEQNVKPRPFFEKFFRWGNKNASVLGAAFSKKAPSKKET